MKNKLTIMVTSALTTVVLAGCASTPWGTESASQNTAAAEIELQKAELARREEALARQQSELEAEKLQLTNARNELQSQAAAERDGGDALIPPDPKPGECYARVIIPAKYEAAIETVKTREASEHIEVVPEEYDVVSETRVVSERSTRLEVDPAVYETVEEQVMIKPPTTRLEVVEAVYEWVDEEILVKEAVTRTEEVAAVYKPGTERVLVQEERIEWKRASDIGAGGSVDLADAAQMLQRFGDYEVLDTRFEDTGVLMCLVRTRAIWKDVPTQVLVTPAGTRTVEVRPAEYKTVKRRVQKTPPTTVEVPIPAEYRMIEVTKLVREATVREVPIPAEYEPVDVVKLVEAARESTKTIPAEYAQVRTNRRVEREKVRWRPVLCEVNMTRENVSALQSALNQAGSCRCGPNRNACSVDGIIGECTLQAVQRYAERQGLSWGNNYVTIDVIRSLGLTF